MVAVCLVAEDVVVVVVGGGVGGRLWLCRGWLKLGERGTFFWLVGS